MAREGAKWTNSEQFLNLLLESTVIQVQREETARAGVQLISRQNGLFSLLHKGAVRKRQIDSDRHR